MQITQEVFNQISYKGEVSDDQLKYLGETRKKGWVKRLLFKTILIGEIDDLLVLRDEYIKRKYDKLSIRQSKKVKSKTKTSGSKEYAILLRRPEWKAKRLEVIARDLHKCTMCDKTKYLQVHHISYVYGKMPWEYGLSNLVTLCAGCHRKIHRITDKKSTKGKKYKRKK
jgi:predicted HNH restriction endonuclease